MTMQILAEHFREGFFHQPGVALGKYGAPNFHASGELVKSLYPPRVAVKAPALFFLSPLSKNSSGHGKNDRSLAD
jgi:hypothetical protein